MNLPRRSIYHTGYSAKTWLMVLQAWGIPERVLIYYVVIKQSHSRGLSQKPWRSRVIPVDPPSIVLWWCPIPPSEAWAWSARGEYNIPLMTHLSVTLRDSLAMPRILRILCLSVIVCVSPAHVLYNHSSLINHQQLWIVCINDHYFINICFIMNREGGVKRRIRAHAYNSHLVVMVEQFHKPTLE